MIFAKKKKTETAAAFAYGKTRHKALLKCSICNGEQVAGFKDLQTGKFHEVMFVRNPKDLELFKETYGLEEVGKEY